MADKTSRSQPEAGTLADSAVLGILLRNFPGLAWTVDENLMITSFSSTSGSELKGTVRMGMALADLVGATADRESILAAHRRVFSGEAAAYATMWRKRHYEVTLEPLCDENGNVISCVGIARDVTELRRLAAQSVEHSAFRTALLELWNQFQESGPERYQQLAETALAAIPGAQSASIWARMDDGLFRPVAATGFDMGLFGSVSLREEDLKDRYEQGPARPEDYDRYGQKYPDTVRLLREAGPVENIMAALGRPIVADGETVAFFNFHNYEDEDAFNGAAHEMATVFAGQLGNLLQRARLEDELRSNEKSLSAMLVDYRDLVSFSADIEAIHDTDQLITHGMLSLLKTLGFDAALFADVRSGWLHFTRVHGSYERLAPELLRTPIRVGSGAAGHAAATGEPVYVQDYSAWPEAVEGHAELGLRNVLALPVRRNGKVGHTISFSTRTPGLHMDANHMSIARAFVARLENAFDRVDHLREIEATRDATFRSFGLALEYRDLETSGHTDRVVRLAEQFAARLSLPPEDTRALTWGAYLHDIGKIAVPDHILLKEGRLTPEEFELVKKHTVYGSEMTQDIPFLPEGTRAVIRHHHEHWNGAGYPDRLASHSIPLLARMFAIIDVYDALTSARPYKQAWTQEAALTEIRRQAGAHFDPVLVREFLDVISAARDD